jgi:hypothetical protein
MIQSGLRRLRVPTFTSSSKKINRSRKLSQKLINYASFTFYRDGIATNKRLTKLRRSFHKFFKLVKYSPVQAGWEAARPGRKLLLAKNFGVRC